MVCFPFFIELLYCLLSETEAWQRTIVTFSLGSQCCSSDLCDLIWPQRKYSYHISLNICSIGGEESQTEMFPPEPLKAKYKWFCMMCLECKYEPKCSTISHMFYIVRVSHIERMFCVLNLKSSLFYCNFPTLLILKPVNHFYIKGKSQITLFPSNNKRFKSMRNIFTVERYHFGGQTDRQTARNRRYLQS